jgi:parallel beta-helix repeat protein
MATYYARKAGNINAADVWATTPSGTAAAVTFASGDVLMANGFTITVNVSTDLGGTGQVRNDTTGGATAGGSFTLSDGVTLTANIYGGTAAFQCVTANPTTNQYIVGNVFGGIGGSSSAHGISTGSSTGTLTITGNLTGGAGLSAGTSAVNNVSANLVVSGNVIGSSNTAFGTGEGIRLTGAGNCTVTGNVTGGSHATNYGVRVTGAGNITVIGQAQGGVAAPAINNESTGQVTVTRAVGNGFGGGSVGLSAAVGVSNVAAQSSITIVEHIEFGTLGQSPVNGRIRLKKMGTNVAVFNFCDTAGAKTLIDATTNAAMPAATDVRSGVSYASGAATGSCAVPAAGSVALGVPVDATTGTAVLTPAAIRAELATELGRIDAAVSSRLAPNGTLATVTTLTNSPNVPSAAAIADEVRVELATELARIDAPVSGATAPSAATVATAVRSELATELARVDVATSTRLATSGYTAPLAAPTAAANATAVRTELATELARVDVATSTRLAGSAYTAPSNSDVTAIKAKTDLLETTRLAQCSTVATTGAQLAAALS